MERNEIYRVIDAQKAISCLFDCSPSFGGAALGLAKDPLNKEDAGLCFTNGCGDGSYYGIKSDSEGNHEVTGEDHKQQDDEKRFTCVELEVYGVRF